MPKKLSAISHQLKYLLIIFGAWCLVLGALSHPVYAASQTFILSKDEVIDSDYFKTGDSLIINGIIKGDAFLIGGIVDVSGNIDGDLFVFGGKINISGNVSQSIRILGGDVSLNGGVGRNVAIIGGNVEINKTATIAGSLLSVSGNLNVNSSKIEKGIRYFGGRMYVNSRVPKDVFVVANDELILGPEASIAGNLKYTGSKMAIFEKGATVSGQIQYEPESQNNGFPKYFQSRRFLDTYAKVKPLVTVSNFLVSLFIGFILLNLFPRFFEKIAVAIEKEPYSSFGWGIIGVLLAILAIILLAITIIGIPIAILVALIFFLTTFLAKIAISFLIGWKLLKTKVGERRGWALFTGLVIYYLLDLIPILGGLIKLSLSLLALGAMILSYRQNEIFKGTPLWQEIHKEK